jgi:hypothetical protein
MSAKKQLRRKLPVNASRGEKRLAMVLDEIFCSNGMDMTIIYQQPLADLGDDDMVESYGVSGMTVDFFVRELGMAIEFQGAQHYGDNGHFVGQWVRDNKKKAFLEEADVTLVEIPYSLGEDFTAKDIRERLGI